MRLRTLTFLGALICVWYGGLTAASAETLTWHFANKNPSIVNVELYSKTRNHVWPGNGKVFTFRDGRQHVQKINCQPGERVCYGGWVRGRGHGSETWGVGMGGKGGCERCCYTCNGGQTPVLEILDEQIARAALIQHVTDHAVGELGLEPG